jgi:5-formyltetrahydrofolate cyclo-ligase
MGAVPGSALAGHIWFPPDVNASEDFPATAHGGPVTHPFAEPRVIDKQMLRTALKQRRREHVAAIPAMQLGLLFRRPPEALVRLVPEGATIGLYHEMPAEAPAGHYARWFFERGHRIALPWFADRAAPMAFREWTNPCVEDLLEPDPFKAKQPASDSAELTPEVLFVPLVGFSDRGGRLGLGAGHYDRWLAAHPPRLAIGLAWDCQLVDDLPTEPHDHPLDAVITPTRLYGPF